MSAPSLANIADAFATMRSAFQPRRAEGVRKTIQFTFTGREPGTWTVDVADGDFTYREGAADHADARVTADSDAWLAMLRSHVTPLDAALYDGLRIEGDMGLVIRIQQWFDRPPGI